MATIESSQSIVDFLRVLADPTRLEILNYLKDNEMSASEIKNILHKSQSTTSKHLNILVSNKLINFKRKNNIKYYHLNESIGITDLMVQISSILNNIKKEIRDADIINTLS